MARDNEQQPAQAAPVEAHKQTSTERFFLREDQAFDSRVNWFLGLQTALTVAFANGYKIEKQGWSWPYLLVWTFGTITACAWLSVSMRQLPNIEAQKLALERIDCTYAALRADRRARDERSCSPVIDLLGRYATTGLSLVLPTVFITLWLAASAYVLFRLDWPIAGVVLVLLLIEIVVHEVAASDAAHLGGNAPDEEAGEWEP